MAMSSFVLVLCHLTLRLGQGNASLERGIEPRADGDWLAPWPRFGRRRGAEEPQIPFFHRLHRLPQVPVRKAQAGRHRAQCANERHSPAAADRWVVL